MVGHSETLQTIALTYQKIEVTKQARKTCGYSRAPHQYDATTRWSLADPTRHRESTVFDRTRVATDTPNLMNQITREEHNVVLQRRHRIENVSGIGTTVLEARAIQTQLAASKSLWLSIEIIHERDNPSLAKVGVLSKEIAIVASSDACDCLSHRKEGNAKPLNDPR